MRRISRRRHRLRSRRDHRRLRRHRILGHRCEEVSYAQLRWRGAQLGGAHLRFSVIAASPLRRAGRRTAVVRIVGRISRLDSVVMFMVVARLTSDTKKSSHAPPEMIFLSVGRIFLSPWFRVRSATPRDTSVTYFNSSDSAPRHPRHKRWHQNPRSTQSN